MSEDGETWSVLVNFDNRFWMLVIFSSRPKTDAWRSSSRVWAEEAESPDDLEEAREEAREEAWEEPRRFGVALGSRANWASSMAICFFWLRSREVMVFARFSVCLREESWRGTFHAIDGFAYEPLDAAVLPPVREDAGVRTDDPLSPVVAVSGRFENFFARSVSIF